MNEGLEQEESVRKNDLFGLWADQDDLTDPRTRVRTLRQNRYPLSWVHVAQAFRPRVQARHLR